MIISYFIGQRHYPLPYNIKKFFMYVGTALAIYIFSSKGRPLEMLSLSGYIINTILLGLFIVLAYFTEKSEFKTLRNG
jgi:phosphate starvation-inducible membrane PsiE